MHSMTSKTPISLDVVSTTKIYDSSSMIMLVLLALTSRIGICIPRCNDGFMWVSGGTILSFYSHGVEKFNSLYLRVSIVLVMFLSLSFVHNGVLCVGIAHRGCLWFLIYLVLIFYFLLVIIQSIIFKMLGLSRGGVTHGIFHGGCTSCLALYW